MTALSSSFRAMLWWLVPLEALAVLIGFEVDWGRGIRKPMPDEAPVAPKPVATALLPDFQVEGGLAAHGETAGRTLFNPTRRPAPVQAAEGSKPRIARGMFALTGTVVVEGKSTAFLRETAGGKSRRVMQGETVNGMLVREVKADRVVLAQGDETEELTLKVAAGPKTTTQPAAAGPVAAAVPAGAVPAVAPPPAAPPAAYPSTLAGRRAAARAADAARNAAAPAPPAAPPADGGFGQMYQQRYGTDGQQQPAPAATTGTTGRRR